MTDFGFPAHEFRATAVDVDAAPAAMTGRLMTAADALAFMNAGKATVTLVSVRTGARFTFRLSRPDDSDVIFVGLLAGPDNTADYAYLGRVARGVFWAGRKVPRAGDVGADAPSSKAFAWAWKTLQRGVIPAELEIWHEGRCGRCARKLTVPASIASGFGPECAGRM